MRISEAAIIQADELAIERSDRQALPTLRDLVAILFRQRRPMLIAFALVIAAVALSGVWIPQYEGRMKILALRQRLDAMVTPSANAPAQFSNDQVSEEDLNSEVELLNSDDLLRKVVLAAGLAGQPGLSASESDALRIAKAVRTLGKDLKIEPLRKTNVICVSYQAREPRLAEDVLKALAAAYMEKHREVHHPSGEFRFFDQQAEQYRQGLDQAQAKLTSFTKGTGVVSADQERDAALREADTFDSMASQSRATAQEFEQRITALQAQRESIKPRVTTVVRTSDNPQLFEQLKSTLLNLRLKRTELLTKFEPTYPLVQEVDVQITETQNAINSEESKPIRDESSDQNPNYQWIQAELTKARTDLSGLNARATATAAIASRYRARAESLNQSRVTQQNLEQAVKSQDENYLLYSHKREEARISNALDQGGILNVALAEQPVVPALPKHGPLSVGLLTLVLAGTLSISTAFVVDFTNQTFRTPDELASYLGTPVLAALPKGKKQPRI